MIITPPTAPQLDQWNCSLEAIDAQRNIARSYRVDATRDLFGHIIVTLGWGRIGSPGRKQTISFDSADAARRFIHANLNRRGTAPHRIGATYRQIG